jgi:Zn-dependent protease with chaperone function
MTDRLLEASRDFFAWIEANPNLVAWVKSKPVPLESDEHPDIVNAVSTICREADIAPIALYRADMPIPHVVCMPEHPDKSKLVISNLLLQPPFSGEQAAMYIAHKLGHEFHGVKHAFSKEEHRLVVAGFTGGAVAAKVWDSQIQGEAGLPEAGSLLDGQIGSRRPMTRRSFIAKSAMAASAAGGLFGWKPVFDHNNEAREAEADREAVALLKKPEVLQGLLLNMRRWCIDNQKNPEEIYPGIQARIMHAERLVAENRKRQELT